MSKKYRVYFSFLFFFLWPRSFTNFVKKSHTKSINKNNGVLSLLLLYSFGQILWQHSHIYNSRQEKIYFPCKSVVDDRWGPHPGRVELHVYWGGYMCVGFVNLWDTNLSCPPWVYPVMMMMMVWVPCGPWPSKAVYVASMHTTFSSTLSTCL